MANFFYSASQNLILWSSLKDEFKANDSWPDDALALTDEQAEEFINSPPEGKMRVAGDDGFPAWIDIPPPTQEEQTAVNEQQQSKLRMIADLEIAWRQDAVDVGIATDEETAALVDWKRYRVLLMRFDTAAPDINWPLPPAL